MVTLFHSIGWGSTSQSDVTGDWLVFREEGEGSEYEDTIRLTMFARKKKNVSHVLHLFDRPQGRAGMEKCGGAAGKAKMWP